MILFSNGYLKRNINTTKYFVTFANGIMVTVEASAQLLQLMVKVPDEYLGKTSGLLGYFDKDKEREFLLPNGTFLNTSSRAANLHYQFGLEWAVDANQSLFTYYGVKDHSFFTKPNFVPLLFDYDNLTFSDANLEAEAKSICEDDVQCLVDVIATGQPSFAMMSRNITKEYRHILSTITRKDCIPLDPELSFGYMQTKDLKDGNIQYLFGCDPNFILDGSDRVSCKNGTWNGTKPSCKGCSPIGPHVVVLNITLTLPGKSEVTYHITCESGYEMFGEGVMKCRDKEWLGNKTRCLKECPPIGSNVVVLNKNPTGLDEVTFEISCASEYEMSGPNIMKCKAGEWLWNKTTCLKGAKRKAQIPPKDFKNIIAISIACVLGLAVVLIVVYCCLRRKKVRRRETIHGREYNKESIGEKKEVGKENTAVMLSVLDLSK